MRHYSMRELYNILFKITNVVYLRGSGRTYEGLRGSGRLYGFTDALQTASNPRKATTNMITMIVNKQGAQTPQHNRMAHKIYIKSFYTSTVDEEC